MTENIVENRAQLQAVAHASEFCATIENAAQYEKSEFVRIITELLPALYMDFATAESTAISDDYYTSDFIDEDYYESVRRQMESVFGADDMFLETFEEDMKYSDTPIAVSISESLADIFQDLYNFISAVRETDGDLLREAFADCSENFKSIWGQTLANVMRPLTHLRFHGFQDDNI